MFLNKKITTTLLSSTANTKSNNSLQKLNTYNQTSTKLKKVFILDKIIKINLLSLIPRIIQTGKIHNLKTLFKIKIKMKIQLFSK
jgi:diacylglycerol kinase family enzyme